MFYDALRYYRDDIVKVNTDFYSEEEVQTDKNELIEAVANIVENRRNILLDEIKDIKESFTSIKRGHLLTETEVKAIQNAIQKIESLQDLRKRVPSFVYENFIDKYLKYYDTVCRAWNTKHAVHRNFGYYELRDIDIYYNGSVVAAGINDFSSINGILSQKRCQHYPLSRSEARI